MEAVDDVVVGDVADGGAGVEESFEVRPQSFPALLLAQPEVVSSSWMMDGALKVVDEERFQVLPGVDGVPL